MRPYSNFDVERLLRELEDFNSRFMKDMEAEMENMEKAIRSGELRGKWDLKKIDEPGVKGYIAYGRFESDRPLEPFEPRGPFDPFRPFRRPPTPRRPFKIPSADLKEIREPLVDIFEEDEAIKLYIELPGEEKENIQLNVANGKVEVKAKKFYKTIDLPPRNIDAEKTAARYKNGVLEVTVPKTGKTKDESRKVKVE